MALNSGSPVKNVGTSINFDAQALHDAEEAEYHREEQERQNELLALLTNAFDDLSDEEEGSVGSRGNTSLSSQDHLQQSQRKTEQQWTGQMPWHRQFYAQTSTPIMNSVPPLATPLTEHYRPAYQSKTQESVEENLHHINDDNTLKPESVDDNNAVYDAPHYAEYMWQGSGGYPAHPTQGRYSDEVHPMQYAERGEIEGANVDDMHYINPRVDRHNQNGDNNQVDINYVYDDYPPGGYQDNGPNSYPQNVHRIEPVGIMNQENDLEHSNGADMHYPRTSEAEPVHDYPQGEPNTMLTTTENYTVRYTGNLPAEREDQTGSGQEHEAEEQLEPTSHAGGQYHQLQQQFLEQVDNSAECRRLAQLEILYKARGKKVEELSQELSAVKEDNEREIRILKHKLSLAQDENSGMTGSLTESQKLVAESKARESALQNQVTSLESQMQRLCADKEQILKKLQAAEQTIEALNSQVTELGSSESLVRAREQHDSIVAGLQQKYEEQLHVLREKLDSEQRLKEDKDEEISSLNKQVKEVIKASENAQIDRADSINRLARSLEDSQRQCQELLEAGNGQEIGKLKVQLQDAIAGKSIAEDTCTGLHEEMRELKEQITMYESASQFGVFQEESRTTAIVNPLELDDSYTQLGIRNPLTTLPSTPDSKRSEVSSLTAEETITGLKKELERCLEMYRNKRLQLQQLQAELKSTKSSLTETRQQLDIVDADAKKAKEQLKLLEEKFPEVDVVGSSDLLINKETNRLKEERVLLVRELEEEKKKVAEIGISEEKVNEVNRGLSRQMAQLVKEFDKEKQQALESCREEVSRQLKHGYEIQHEVEKNTLIENYEHQINELKEELSKSHGDLDEVKELYVSVCHSKDQLEDQLHNQVDTTIQGRIEEIKSQLNKEKEDAIERLKMSMETKVDSTLALEKEKWQAEQEEKVKNQLEIEVENASIHWKAEQDKLLKQAAENARVTTEQELREKWKAEHDKLVKQAAENATVATEQEWQQKWEDHLDKQLQLKVQEVETQLLNEKTKYVEGALEEKIAAAKEKWQQTELRQALQQAKDEAQKEQRIQMEAELEEAKATLLHDYNDQLRQAVQRAKDDTAEQDSRQFEEAMKEIKDELESYKSTKLGLERDLETKQETWAKEKQLLIQQKDSERRLAVQEVQDQCENDYRTFLSEHNDTLNKALKSARDQFEHEKAELIKRYEREIAAATQQEPKEQQIRSEFEKEKAALEVEWQKKLEAISMQHEEEKETMRTNHRLDLSKAVHEAKLTGLKQKGDVLDKSQDTLYSRQNDWEEKRAHYVSEIQKRDKMLEAVDAHMETEINKLLLEVESSYQRNLQQELNSAQKKLNAKHQSEIASRLEENKKLGEKVRDLTVELQRMKQGYDSEVQALKKSVSSKQDELQIIQAEKDNYQKSLSKVEAQKKEFSQKLTDSEKQLQKAEKQRQEVVESYRKSEEEHAQILDGYKQRQVELSEKTKSLAEELSAVENKATAEIQAVRESLEEEHSLAMDNMRVKMVDLRNNHLAALEAARKKHATEKYELKQTIHVLEKRSREFTHTPTQTDLVAVEEKALDELRIHYLDALAKMKIDIMQHVSQSNSSAAETVKRELEKERHVTARRLRKYYMKCLNQLLDKEHDGKNKQAKMCAMEQALNNIPERDSSQASSRSTTPGIVSDVGSTTPTPRDYITDRGRTSEWRSQGYSSVSEIEICRSGSITPTNENPVFEWGTPKQSQSSFSRSEQEMLEDIANESSAVYKSKFLPFNENQRATSLPLSEDSLTSTPKSAISERVYTMTATTPQPTVHQSNSSTDRRSSDNLYLYSGSKENLVVVPEPGNASVYMGTRSQVTDRVSQSKQNNYNSSARYKPLSNQTDNSKKSSPASKLMSEKDSSVQPDSSYSWSAATTPASHSQRSARQPGIESNKSAQAYRYTSIRTGLGNMMETSSARETMLDKPSSLPYMSYRDGNDTVNGNVDQSHSSPKRTIPQLPRDCGMSSDTSDYLLSAESTPRDIPSDVTAQIKVKHYVSRASDKPSHLRPSDQIVLRATRPESDSTTDCTTSAESTPRAVPRDNSVTRSGRRHEAISRGSRIDRSADRRNEALGENATRNKNPSGNFHSTTSAFSVVTHKETPERPRSTKRSTKVFYPKEHLQQMFDSMPDHSRKPLASRQLTQHSSTRHKPNSKPSS